MAESLKAQLAKLRRLRKKYYLNPGSNEKIIFALETRIELLNQQIITSEGSRNKERFGEILL